MRKPVLFSALFFVVSRILACDVDNPPRLFASAPVLGPGHTVKLWVQNGYLPQVPVLVRVELLSPSGERDWAVWDIDASLSVDKPGVTLSTNRIPLRNGMGSGLVTFSGGGDFNLTATINSLQATRPLQSLQGVTPTTVGGTLPGTATLWSGVVRVTNDVTVPVGHTLTIQSNTLVIIDGVASGTTANDILVSGTILSQGTEQHPVTITCSSATLNWGQIRHNNAQPSTYRYTTITKGGRGPGEGHTGTASLIRPTNSRITFESCNLGDITAGGVTIGKIMQTFATSDLTFNDCLLSRARSGPEIESTALLLTNSYILDISGTDDADGIYLHTQAAGQQMRITHTVIAFGDDDGIDTLGPTVAIDNTIVRNYCDKAVSVLDGRIDMDKTLLADDTHGISAKSQSENVRIPINVNRSTIAVATNGIAVINKSGPTNTMAVYRMTNCIVRAFWSVVTDYSPTNYLLGYCNVTPNFSGKGNTPAANAALEQIVMSGPGMTTAFPLFVAQNSDDYHLQPYSLCIDAGDPSSPRDPDGSPMDLGFYPFVPDPPSFSQPIGGNGGPFQFNFNGYSNRNYVVEYSDALPVWSVLKTNFQSSETVIIQDPAAAGSPQRLYRARLAP
jgi:hypothetical protein